MKVSWYNTVVANVVSLIITMVAFIVPIKDRAGGIILPMNSRKS